MQYFCAVPCSSNMFTVCIFVIALLQLVEGLKYAGEPLYLIDIPRENRNDSMCRNETVEKAQKDVKKADDSYCPGLLAFIDLLMNPTGETEQDNFIRIFNDSVYGPVIENFTIVNSFSDKDRLLRNIWFRGNNSLFNTVFVHNYGNVSRISSFASYLYQSLTQTATSSHHSRGHQNCTNETEVSIVACYSHPEPKSIVYLDEVNPLFDFTVFSIAAMMGKLIENKTTRRNLTFVVQHPNDRDCLVPLTVLYWKVNNPPPIYLTYNRIKAIYYDYNGKDGKTNFDVCGFEPPKDTIDEDEYYDETYEDYDDESSNATMKIIPKKEDSKEVIRSSLAKAQVKKQEREETAKSKSNF